MKYKDFTPVVRGFAGGGFGVLTGMLTSVTGAMIFSSTDCGGFHLSEATKVSALGQGILLGSVSALSNSTKKGFFKTEVDPAFFTKIVSSSAHVALVVFGSMLGYAVEKSLHDPDATREEMALIILLGATLLVIPMWVINMKASQHISSLVDAISTTLNKLDKLDVDNQFVGYDSSIDNCTLQMDAHHPHLLKQIT